MKKTGSTSHLFDLPLFSKGRRELLSLLEKGVFSGKKGVVVLTPNPEQVVQAADNDTLYTHFTQADYLLPDGIGLVWATRLLSLRGKSRPVAERISGIDVASDLLERARHNHWKVVVLGGRDYPSDLAQHYPGLSITWLEGYVTVAHPTSEEETQVEKTLRSLQPDIVFVAFGAPHQERWILDHRDLLEESNVSIAMAVGGTFDILFGGLTRAPRFLRKVGLEWLYRLVTQPWRWRRQLRLIRFAQLVMATFFS